MMKLMNKLVFRQYFVYYTVSRGAHFRDILQERIVNVVKPVITTPLKLLAKTKKIRTRRMESQNRWQDLYGVDRRKAKVIISCPNKSDNHYSEQRYPRNTPFLGSEFWKNNKHSGEIITINQREKAKNVFFQNEDEEDETDREDNCFIPTNFDEFQINPILKETLKRSFDKPTKIQSLAFSKIFSGANAIIAAETGSGKTLAYLLPCVEQLLLSRRSFGVPIPNCPRAIVLTPNLELTSQIFNVLQTLIAGLDLSALKITGTDFDPRVLDKPIDIIVGTPGRLAKFKRLEALDTSYLNHVIIDEADTLLDRTFKNVVFDLLENVQFDRCGAEVNSYAQLTVCSATVFDYVDEFLAGFKGLEISGFERVTTSNLHILQPHIVHKFIRLIKPELPERLLLTLKRGVNKPCIIFVKNVEQGYFLFKFLGDHNNLPCQFLHRNLRNKYSDCEQILDDFRNGKTKILISTNLGSRGLDVPNARHVINYDFPKTLADYLHRAGRLARAGSTDQSGFAVTSFVYDKASAEMIKLIETAVRTDRPLRDIFVNIREDFYQQNKANAEPGIFKKDKPIK